MNGGIPLVFDAINKAMGRSLLGLEKNTGEKDIRRRHE